ncbi:HNH endonuclease [Kribbella sindirgiensis]|uniref:HNH endonuclease n=2 Tax=Kribbella sindirgiensis TaxID=1124744 RepID=A0A4R0I3L1_9ACTN|nr:HNH endonuclease [Kribbella sindirgiensis]
MSGDEMVSALDATYAEIARLKTYALHLTGGLETIGYAKEVGAGTTARFLTFRYRIDATEARRDVHLANALPKYPAVAAALPNPAPEAAVDDAAEGDTGRGVLLHPAQAEAIVSALDKVPTTVPVEDLAVAEREMVELGRTHGPLDLRKAGVQVRNRLDTDGPEPAEQEAYDRETLTLKTVDNGVAFTGFLANENAELFRTLIDTHAKPHRTVDGALDPRSRDQRQADALTTVLNTATSAVTNTAPSPATGGLIPGHGQKPQIIVTIDFNDLKAADATATGQLIYGDALSAATIRRLACDAHILPVVLGSDSQPLDVGTTVRLATGPMRKALITRDKGCVCCGAPPLYCDAHHVISWIDGGETNITNLVLLCKRCHRDLHAGHWNINITDGTVHVTRPTWATPAPVPRGRYRPPTTTRHPTETPPATAPPGPGTSGVPARAWPRDTDPPWITPEAAARLNPWGDTPNEQPTGIDGGLGTESELDATVDRRSKAALDSDGVFDPWSDLAPGCAEDLNAVADGSETATAPWDEVRDSRGDGAAA